MPEFLVLNLNTFRSNIRYQNLRVCTDKIRKVFLFIQISSILGRYFYLVGGITPKIST